jgi:hypothetical protein
MGVDELPSSGSSTTDSWSEPTSPTRVEPPVSVPTRAPMTIAMPARDNTLHGIFVPAIPSPPSMGDDILTECSQAMSYWAPPTSPKPVQVTVEKPRTHHSPSDLARDLRKKDLFVEKPDRKEPLGRGQYGPYPKTRLRSTTRCYNSSTLGHFATDCPEPRKPRADRLGNPIPNRSDKAKATQPGIGPTSQPTFSSAEYWTSCAAVRTTHDQPWIRFNRAYLKEILPVLPPGPDILLSRDVERNPGPHPYPRQLGVIVYTIDDLEGMA